MRESKRCDTFAQSGELAACHIIIVIVIISQHGCNHHRDHLTDFTPGTRSYSHQSALSALRGYSLPSTSTLGPHWHLFSSATGSMTVGMC